MSDLLGRLGWLSAEELAAYYTLSMVHKVRCSGEPEVLAAELTTVAEARGLDLAAVTRQDRQLFVPRSRTEMGRMPDLHVITCQGHVSRLAPPLLRSMSIEG